MGVYKAYKRMARMPAIKWVGIPMSAEERFRAERRERLLNKPIDRMGLYHAWRNYSKKWAYEQKHIREMRGCGATIEEIAYDMQTSEKVIRARLAGGWKN
jgi:hypothetical protein